VVALWIYKISGWERADPTPNPLPLKKKGRGLGGGCSKDL